MSYKINQEDNHSNDYQNYMKPPRLNSELEAENAALRAEVERLNAVIESNIDEGINKIMLMSDEQISALAGFEGRSTEDQETTARQCFEIAEQRVDHMKLVEENHELRQQLAISQLEAKRLREALEASDNLLRDLPTIGGFYGLSVVENNEQALSSQTSTEELDAYVAEKVKEITSADTFDQWNVNPYRAILKKEIARLTRQRDLAVSALQFFMDNGICEATYYNVRDALAAIKESEV